MYSQGISPAAIEAHRLLGDALSEIYEVIEAMKAIAECREHDQPVRAYTLTWLAEKAMAGFGDSFDYLQRLDPRAVSRGLCQKIDDGADLPNDPA